FAPNNLGHLGEVPATSGKSAGEIMQKRGVVGVREHAGGESAPSFRDRTGKCGLQHKVRRSRRYASILLTGVAVAPLLLAQSANAISLNDPAANQAGGIQNFYDSTNQYPNVVDIRTAANVHQCTGTLINSRTILTAAHCFEQEVSVSFT